MAEIENTAPRIDTAFRPPDADRIQAQRRKQRRKERRVKRIITVAVGYSLMALMLYLITVTQIATPKIWDPYSILGISRVSITSSSLSARTPADESLRPRSRSRNATACSLVPCIPTKLCRIRARTNRRRLSTITGSRSQRHSKLSQMRKFGTTSSNTVIRTGSRASVLALRCRNSSFRRGTANL